MFRTRSGESTGYLVPILRAVFSPILSAIEWLISKPANEDNNGFLAKPWKPVDDEEDATECEVVQGKLPRALNGAFMRNGPNPMFAPTGRYHLFDGDGMVHAIRIKDGSATYSSRYVQTIKLATEKKAKRALYMKIGDLASCFAQTHVLIDVLRKKLGICRVTDESGVKGRGSTANTSLQYFAGRLLALNEGDLPYALRVMCDGVIETIGMLNFDGKLKTPFTAHPKSLKGMLYAIGNDMGSTPGFTFHVIDGKGHVERSLFIRLPAPVLMHDMAVTEKRAIFLDFPLGFNPAKLFSSGLPIEFEPRKPARFGLLPLDSRDAALVSWYTLPEPIVAFHTLNAWEDDKNREVHVLLCAMKTLDLNDLPAAHGVTKPGKRDELSDLVHYVIHLDTRQVTVEHVCRIESAGMDFPQINQRFLGKKNKFGYCVTFDPNPTGLAKIDLQAECVRNEKNIVEQIRFGAYRFGGEAIFVPDPERGGNGKPAAEDAGFLATFVTDESRNSSEFVVWDAQNMSAGPVATVALPCRIPLGFHATFLNETELANLKKGQ